jgi:hypothetical protein
MSLRPKTATGGTIHGDSDLQPLQGFCSDELPMSG